MTSREQIPSETLLIGIDVGSTTVKAVAVDGRTRRIVWSDYQRHETRQAEKVVELLEALEEAFPDLSRGDTRVFLTGSGSRPLVEPTGGFFVQEVNAVTLAVEALHPEVGSVIELGGQDAKIIIFKPNPETGEKQPLCSMNDKCASGTGATIDKCMIKVGMPEEEVRSLRFDAERLHKVAAKCGVFAETDIVNLVKSGIPSPEIMCSLADAIVGQNLSVLTRGNTLFHQVLLLGGPNTYLPFLQECWRLRIPETWAHRGHEFPRDVPIEELVLVPDNAQYYAAYGAVIYGLEEPSQVGRYRGLDALRTFVAEGRAGGGQVDKGLPLVRGPEELETFRARYSIPRFEPARFAAGTTVRAAIGLDGGSTSSKAVLVSEDGDVLAKAYQLSKGNPIRDMKELLADLKGQLDRQSCQLEVLGFGVTGYAADVVEESVLADVSIVETVAHVMSATHFFDEVDVICDIGGQDIKVLFLRNGEIKDFRLSNQCSAGNGMLLQAMAAQFGVPIEAYAETAFKATLSPTFSYGCAVFLDSDRVNFQKEGYSKEELLAGLAMVLPKNVWQYVVQVPRLAELGHRYVLQGGTQYNLAAVKAQVDYIAERVPGAEIHVHPHCGEAGAIGAAIEALRVVGRRGSSSFVGLERAIGIRYSTTNDESSRCHFCPNLCARTFVDTKTEDGRTSRYISGFSCEKGTVESKEAMVELVKHRKELKKSYVNLVEYEARLAFRSFYTLEPLPEAGAAHDGPAARRGVWSRIRGGARRTFQRSSESEQSHRRRLRIGIPRVLNLYSTAPFFRAYLETLGVRSQNVRFSPATTEEMYQEGARYGSVDPCYPAKVAQAHIHQLLFHEHKPPRKALDIIFFPTLTHVPTFVEGTLDSTTCPIVAGTPNVMKAAFTKDVSFFADRGIDYVDGAVTLEEPFYLKRQMFEMWGDRLRITEDESDFAVDQGFRALRWFDEEMQRRGMDLLEQVEAEHRVAILMLGRPYHGDPGLNHGILEEFQALGYPILSIRSIPKDPGWLGRWFREDLERGRIASPLEIGDVWPENYSTNSVQKVWAAKFAARHPNVAILDLSSFKCGHDAPTYGLIDSIVKAGKVPFMALHDLDANKPAGSQMIRVKTYAHTLSRYREELADRAERWSELERVVAGKRIELLEMHRRAVARAALEQRERRRELEEMQRAFDDYLDEDEAVFGIRLADLENAFPSAPPNYDATADVAPLAPTEEVLARVASRRDSGFLELPVVGAGAAGGGGACGSGGCGSCGS